MFVFARGIYLLLRNDEIPTRLGVMLQALKSLGFFNFVRKWGGGLWHQFSEKRGS
jgi:hypothetical protein